MAEIFVSYRSDDEPYAAADIHSALCDRFGASKVFLDSSMEPGTVYPRTIRSELAESSVLIVVIGRRWLAATDAAGNRRIDNERDWVRMEVGYGLRSDLRVIPVLLQGVTFPEESALPEDLRELTHRQAMVLRHGHRVNDLAALVEAVAGEAPSVDRPKAATAQYVQTNQASNGGTVNAVQGGNQTNSIGRLPRKWSKG